MKQNQCVEKQTFVPKQVGPVALDSQSDEKDVSPGTPRRFADGAGKNDGERPGDWFDDIFAVDLDNVYEDMSATEKVAERLGILFEKSQDKRLAQTKPDRPVVDTDEEDEEDLPANFNLKDRLSALAGEVAKAKRADGLPQLEVIKSIGNRVVDVQYIGRGRRYRIDNGSTRFRLAALSAKNRGYISFPETWQGHLLSNGKKEALDDYKTEKYLRRKRARLYRLPIFFGDTFVAVDGDCEYQVRHTVGSESPTVVHPPKEKEITWRYWGASSGFHLIFVMIACIIFAVSSRVPEEENLHFVKVDMSRFEEQPLPEPEVKETPEKVAPVEKPVERPVEKSELPKIEPAKKTPEIKKTVVKKTAKSTQKADAKDSGGSEGAAGSHPDAGGGFGEGEVVNRNINQTGLLSLLGDGTAAGSSADAVIAEATNLDAVAVPGASEKQFSVGGIKGSLGTGNITLASGQAVQTKGGRQVLQSAGVEGPGAVAALERGEVGSRQVKGMVTAQMTKTVSIQGGMSREMVKRVIDLHLEEIQYCYESALMENPAIMGRIVYEWKILLSGKVGEVRIASSTVNSHRIHDCIKASIQSWQFPKPVGTEVVVSYPFVFDLVGF